VLKIPESYLLNKFYSHSHEPTFKKYEGTYNAGCPVCREGKSLGKKKRLFYYPKTQSFYCFNCNKSWNGVSWLTDVTGMSIPEIKSEISSQKNSFEIDVNKQVSSISKKISLDLPYDSINLNDPLQLSYYQNNNIINKALDYIKNRKLNVAVNRSKNLFISLKDFIHKDRLCIPFYDENKKVIFYQTRCLDDSQPRYLGKQNSDKSIFNIEKIDSTFDYIFLLEGPIDAMFIKNGIGVAGINLTNNQKEQLSRYPLHQKIWILDNPRIDATSQSKIQELLYNKEKVFCWNNQYKDLNEWCVSENINVIHHDTILNSLYQI
jgi:uncharacterized protein YxjI